MTNLYCLCNENGEELCLIKTSLKNHVISNLWETFYNSNMHADLNDESEIDTFLPIIQKIDPTAERIFYNQILP
jgi:hypothetical protein